MNVIVAHLGFIILLIVGIALILVCEYARRKIKEKPRTLTWSLLSVLVYVLYALGVVILVFDVLTEIFM